MAGADFERRVMRRAAAVQSDKCRCAGAERLVRLVQQQGGMAVECIQVVHDLLRGPGAGRRHTVGREQIDAFEHRRGLEMLAVAVAELIEQEVGIAVGVERDTDPVREIVNLPSAPTAALKLRPEPSPNGATMVAHSLKFKSSAATLKS
jgi:hypothetical protein